METRTLGHIALAGAAAAMLASCSGLNYYAQAAR